MRPACVLAAVSFLVLATDASPQLAVPGAEKGKISILAAGSAFFVDVGSAKVGLVLRGEDRGIRDCNLFQGQAQIDCMQASLSDDRWLAELGVAISAKDGKRDLFSGGEVVPGAELGFLTGYQWEHDDTGFHRLYAGFTLAGQSLQVADTAGGTAVLRSQTQRGFAGLLGYTHFFDESLGVGLSGRLGREFASPGARELRQVCIQELSLMDAASQVVTVAHCKERYVGPLDDGVDLGQIRGEFVKTFLDVGSESFGVLASLQVSPREDIDAPWAFTLGGFVTPPDKPHQILMALLLQFTDFTDANDKDKGLKEIFSLGLRLGIPLTGF